MFAAGALLPVRGLTEAAARSLLGPPYADSPPADPEAPGARGRLAAFWLCHLALGGLVAGLCLAVFPFAVLLLGIALLALLVVFCLASGRLMGTFLAPRLLGPSVAEALAHERARAERLARRNRLARDLHDSVGHSLSVVSLQASAARRVPRRAGPGDAHVRVAVDADAVELEVINPLPNPAARLRDELDTRQRRGGRGLIGIRERVTAAGGECSVGPAGDDWRLWVR